MPTLLKVALSEFESSQDPHAFLLMVSAAHQDGRYFDYLRDIEAHPEMLSVESPVVRAYSKVVPDDVWAQRKLEQFAALGVRVFLTLRTAKSQPPTEPVR